MKYLRSTEFRRWSNTTPSSQTRRQSHFSLYVISSAVLSTNDSGVERGTSRFRDRNRQAPRWRPWGNRGERRDPEERTARYRWRESPERRRRRGKGGSHLCRDDSGKWEIANEGKKSLYLGIVYVQSSRTTLTIEARVPGWRTKEILSRMKRR